MAVDYETVSSTVIEYVKDAANALPISKAYLYGSYAKGTENEYSDVDICFFSESFEGQRPVNVLATLIRLTGKYKDVFIEPKVFALADIEQDNTFVKEILRTGKEVPVIR